MTRAELKEVASTLANQANDKPFEYWASQEYPITWEEKYHGHDIQVEIVRLDFAEDYIHISVAVDDGTWPSCFVPASADIIIKKAR